MPSPYVSFDGNCAEAFAFYEQALGGKVVSILKFKDAPAEAQIPGAENHVMHARMVINGLTLMGSDAGPWSPYQGMKGASLSVNYPDTQEAETRFNALAAGGTVHMPFAKTFWAKGFGVLVDRFGVSWMVNSESK